METGAGDSSWTLQPGQKLGGYELVVPLARGVASSVWAARTARPHGGERLVAIKTIGGALARDDAFRDIFREEVQLAAVVSHPNVAQILDLGEHEDLLYVVTEYVAGDSLFDLNDALDRKRMKVPPAVALRVLADACAGLHAAHLLRDRTGRLLNVVHGDLSAQTILINTAGAVKVIGFGVGKARARVPDWPNGTILSLDSSAPLPPPSLRIDRHADVWAVGATMHQLLAYLLVGARPRGTEPGRAPSVPGAVAELVQRALSTEPLERFATAAEMQGAIEATLVTLGIPTTAASVAAFTAEHLAVRASARAQAVEEALAEGGAPLRIDSFGPTASSIGRGSYAPPSTFPPAQAASTPPSGPMVHMEGPPVVEAPFRPLFSAPPPPPLRSRVAAGALAGSAVFVLGGLGALAFLGWRGQGGQAQTDDVDQAHSAAAAAAPVPAPPPKPTCPAGMIAIPGGKFYMGSDDDLDLERPAHHVTLSPYCIDPYEVTVEQYKACSDAGDCKRAAIENKWDGITRQDSKVYDPLCNVREPMGRAKHPINCVDWQMAWLYCQSHGGRLPTEAEWEFAARGPDGRKYPWGDEEPGPLELNACGKECVAWAKKNKVDLDPMFLGDDGWPNTAPVGSYPAGKSRYGLYDVVGNVWEWTGDYFAPYDSEPQIDPQGGPPAGVARVIRGGAWNGSYASWVRPTFRYKNAPETRSYGIGFRCARSITP